VARNALGLQFFSFFFCSLTILRTIAGGNFSHTASGRTKLALSATGPLHGSSGAVDVDIETALARLKRELGDLERKGFH
jgi:hypothetical protein